jgi:poly-gamma-glutamate synthesis protein (capsule biosynthesis protein)
MNILISGDFYITDAFKNKNIIDQTVIDLFNKADYRMVNMEAPLTANEPKNKILKTGPHLRMSEDTVMPFLKQLKVDVVTLANNHILDYGAKGLRNTFESLKQNKIDYVGAGNNLNEATQPLTLEKDGLRIAILNFCENEWSIAEENKPGANPMDIIDNTNQIKAAKVTHDKVICIIHGGHEYYHLPSPRMQKQYRFYVDNGADAIVGHHTHCIGGYEIYNEVPIIYSLGNFLFALESDKTEWFTGLVVSLKFNSKDTVAFELNIVNQDKNTKRLNIPLSHKVADVNKFLFSINEIIKQKEKINEEWEKFAFVKQNGYLNKFSPINMFRNKYIRALLRNLNRKIYHSRYVVSVLNLLRCQSHFDMLLFALKNRLQQ